MGGILGLVLGFCGAIEYQKNSNPHFHANVYVATVWQQPLKKLAQKIQAKAVTLEELFRYQAWLHNESHFNLQQHEALFPALEKKWMQNFPGTEHDQVMPLAGLRCHRHHAFAVAATGCRRRAAPRRALLIAGTCRGTTELSCPDCCSEPRRLSRQTPFNTDNCYQTAVQVKLSHQQHHMHTLGCQAQLPRATACLPKERRAEQMQAWLSKNHL